MKRENIQKALSTYTQRIKGLRPDSWEEKKENVKEEKWRQRKKEGTKGGRKEG